MSQATPPDRTKLYAIIAVAVVVTTVVLMFALDRDAARAGAEILLYVRRNTGL